MFPVSQMGVVVCCDWKGTQTCSCGFSRQIFRLFTRGLVIYICSAYHTLVSCKFRCLSVLWSFLKQQQTSTLLTMSSIRNRCSVSKLTQDFILIVHEYRKCQRETQILKELHFFLVFHCFFSCFIGHDVPLYPCSWCFKPKPVSKQHRDTLIYTLECIGLSFTSVVCL